ncbi:hypothetical protein [Chitinophaga sp. YIM B06452]|uniref:hypothetical protein n=1 Tax=Chitinophaga sp. YIM B06452 TaxID=3082158 RepID=UPI0031FEDC99
MSEILSLLKNAIMEYFMGFTSAAAKLNLGIGKTTIFRIMHEKGLISKDRQPRQELVDAGYLKFEYKEKFLGNTYKKMRYPYLTISFLGIQWLEPILKDHLSQKRA